MRRHEPWRVAHGAHALPREPGRRYPSSPGGRTFVHASSASSCAATRRSVASSP